MKLTPHVTGNHTRVIAGRIRHRSEVGPIQKGHSAMLWRRLYLVRAAWATGLMVASLGLANRVQSQTITLDSEPSSRPVAVASETVDILSASRAGDLAVSARGHGQDRVRISIQNTSKRRLNVVIPPGLVAANAVGQGAGGGGGAGRGGLQNMGLGSITNREGGFGDFQAASRQPGFKSVAVKDDATRGLAVPAGQTVEVSVPAVCLNYGLPSPIGRNKLRLMDVTDYTRDPRVRKALRGLATLGTSQGVAQSVMWHVCDDLPFETMAAQAGRVMNPAEIELARQYVEVLDASSDERVDGEALVDGRMLVRIRGEGKLAAEAERIARQIEGQAIMGLPAHVVKATELPGHGTAIVLDVLLTSAKVGETRGRVLVGVRTLDQSLTPLARLDLRENSSASVIDGPLMASTLGRTVAGSLVTLKAAKRTPASTTIRVTNRLPFSISNLVLRAGDSAGSPPVPFEALGVGPLRSMLLPVQASGASLVERVELNGL